MNNITKELKEQREGMETYKSYQNRIGFMREEINEKSKKVQELKAICNKKEKELEELKKSGIHTVTLKIRGKYKASTEEAEKALAEARANLQDKVAERDEAENRRQSLVISATKYYNCEMNYKKLYERKLQQLTTEESPAKETILECQYKISICEDSINQIKEAITAGRRIKSELERTERSLNSAKGYGTADIMGGGMLTDAMKHSKLNDAKSSLNHAKDLMYKFNSELADVKMCLDVQIDTDGFAKFADFYFDGLFADMNMQSKILASRDHVISARRRVESAIHKLEEIRNKEEEEAAKYKSRIAEIVNNEEF